MDSVEDFLVEIETLRGNDPAAALDRVRQAPAELANRSEVQLLNADLVFEVQGAQSARPLLERLIAREPDYADARYLLGAVCAELGDEPAKVEQFLEVLRLDEGLDHELEGVDNRELEDLIVSTVEETISALSPPICEKLSSVPILVEPRPSEALVQEGLDPRALGLFEGQTHLSEQNQEVTEVPTRIVLYSANLLAESLDLDQLRDEVETTVLHEVGHYFGLEERDLVRLGLD